jgi:hypothetical protein
MATRFEVSGTGDFKRAAARLRVAEKDLPREVRSAVDKGVRPLPIAVKRSAIMNLPRRGGLNVLVAQARITIKRVSETNAGRVWHPTFGHRPRILQRIPRAKDWFFKPVRRVKPDVKDEIEDALRRVARRIT